MAADEASSGQKLTKLVLGWHFPPSAIKRLEDDLPATEVVVAPDAGFRDALAGAEAAVAWEISPDELAAADRLVWFQSIGAGVERLLGVGLRERGIVLTNTTGLHATNIAEHVLAMMLAFARRLPTLMRSQIRAEWYSDQRFDVFELSGKRLHVLGYGAIGKELAGKAAALGMAVTATRLNAAPGSDEPNASGPERLIELLGEADHVAICLPLTAATSGLFDAAMLGRMKFGAYLYNVGRGPIVDTAALVAALESGHLGGAGLDVTDPEPLSGDSSLWRQENVIITAHTAGRTPHFFDRLVDIVVENARRFQAGEPLNNVVDMDRGY